MNNQKLFLSIKIKFIINTDDLFGDDEEEPPSKKIVKQSPETPKKKYLDEKWTLSPEDSKEFKGFPNNNPPEDVEPSENVPCFALMYKFRKEYLETSVDATLADHRGHCTKFKRLLNSEVINMGKAKGVVLLWAGFTEEDKKETKAEIMSFLEEDPLVMKDVVETWDIIDLSASSPTAALPSA